VGATKFDGITAISRRQVRAARALLGWTQRDLAAASGVPERTLERIESGQTRRPHPRTMAALESALRAAGVEFMLGDGGGPGVRVSRAVAIQQAVNDAKGLSPS
jgi:transcriptional regulator with XRE-family HTH domain